MRIEPLRAWHLESLELQPSQAMFGDVIHQPGYAEMLVRAGPAFAAVQDDTVLGCGGSVEMYPTRAQIWSLISANAGRHMLGIHRAVEGYLKQMPHRRVEAQVVAGFEPGARWLKRLGFEFEGTMRAYAFNGSDCWLYARVR